MSVKDVGTEKEFSSDLLNRLYDLLQYYCVTDTHGKASSRCKYVLVK